MKKVRLGQVRSRQWCENRRLVVTDHWLINLWVWWMGISVKWVYDVCRYLVEKNFFKNFMIANHQNVILVILHREAGLFFPRTDRNQQKRKWKFKNLSWTNHSDTLKSKVTMHSKFWLPTVRVFFNSFAANLDWIGPDIFDSNEAEKMFGSCVA